MGHVAYTGRATHERLPTVGRKLVYPRKRCLAISYVRLLLDDTALKVNQHRMKLPVVDSRECVCGHGIEDEDHFFHCRLYSESRKQLMQAIQDIWSNTFAKGVLPQSVTLLFTPSSFSMFTINGSARRYWKQRFSIFSSLDDDCKPKIQEKSRKFVKT